MMRALLVAMALTVLLGASACTGGRSAGQGEPESLPDASGLLRDSAQTMGELNTVRFNLDIDGTLPGVAIRSAEGVLTKDGNVKGKGQLNQGSGTSEFEFVLVGDTLYLKGPTGGFQRLPAAFAATVYDPSKILDPNAGVPAMLTGTTQARTEAIEDVDGTQAYRIAVTVPKDKLTVLPGVSSDLNGKLWVATDDPKRLLKAKMEVPAPPSGGTPASVTLTLSDFNDPVTITPPG